MSIYRSDIEELVNKSNKIGILLHDNPDPDAIASGWAMYKMIKIISPEKDCQILYRGDISHFSNKLMIKLLNPPIQKLGNGDLEKVKQYMKDLDTLILVDFAKFGKNAQYPIEYKKNIKAIFDHHEVTLEDLDSDLLEIRKIGSCATIMIKLLEDFEINLQDKSEKNLTTALAYGIWSDTHFFKENDSYKEDIDAFNSIFKNIDFNILNQLINPLLNKERMEALKSALNNSYENKGIGIYNVGLINDKTLFGIIGDTMLNQVGTRGVIIFGLYNTPDEKYYKLVASSRTQDNTLNATELLENTICQTAEGFSFGGKDHAARAEINIINKELVDLEELQSILDKLFVKYKEKINEYISK
ncbi:MAG: DHH family phosphoesterase [Candidatus Nanoarchaeia archaeon]|nr:DHH family phosphoesterase [Candidatus Nanoarchaeia archaeon]